MSVSTIIGAVLFGLLGVGMGVVSLSVGYMGSFRSSGLAREDSLFVTITALGGLICMGCPIALFIANAKQSKG